ncbi:unnamed protein product, partial [Staurois parvus]
MYTVITYSSSPPRWWRGCLLSAEESGPLLHLSPQRWCVEEARNRKLETGTRLHKEAWSTAAPSVPLKNFSSHLASGFFKP